MSRACRRVRTRARLWPRAFADRRVGSVKTLLHCPCKRMVRIRMDKRAPGHERKDALFAAVLAVKEFG